MNQYPLVSIILPTYNREKYIKRAIESTLSQTYKNIELIIIDDGSTDKTKDVIQPYLVDQRVHYIYQQNKGASAARNNGIKVSKGKYIAVLDSDDFWCDRKKLEKQVKFLEEHPNYILVGGGMIRINKQGKELVRHLLPETDKEIRKLILFDNLFAHSTVVFRKVAWELAGGYDEELSFSEDWDLWLRFGKLGKFYNFQEYFTCYLQGEQNISNLNLRRNLKLNIKIRKKYRNDYPNFWKAFFLGWAYYYYTFLPFNQFLKPIFSKIRRIIFGPPVYKYLRGQK
jgi:glycosyltransferase involved in cell wall biosynthesis